MPDNIIRTKGRAQQYKFDRGGMPTEMGPYVGIVVNNIDPTRAGRLQVWISQFGATRPDGSPDLADESLWRTVSYIPPFYGSTPHSGTNTGVGTFIPGNQQSYGMWFTPPDLGTEVICFFIAGDPNQGYYTGCIPNTSVNHMIPAIGASKKFVLANGPQDSYFAGATQLPVTEINTENPAIANNPRFFDQTKPVHAVVAGIMMQQGLIKDTVRGPITSNSQRESPSSSYGIITPGKPVYQSGLSDLEIKSKLERDELRPEDIVVIARQGGHSIVLDDGNLEGKDNLVRIRTAKGHQITMSDDGDCFYFIHANGQTWLEFGKQGTVDVFSTNSVNVRTQGTINLHADQDINMFAGGAINIKSTTLKVQTDATMDFIAAGSATFYSKNALGIKADGSLTLKSQSGSWSGGSVLNLQAGCIGLNSGSAGSVNSPSNLKTISLPDTKFVENQGWVVQGGKLKTIVTRAPTHEPYPYHNQGVAANTDLSAATTTPPPAATANKLANLENVPVVNGINSAAFLEQPRAELPVGSLDTTQVTGLLAQVSADVGQKFDTLSVTKGIGQFGLSAAQLESTGLLKPGTVQSYLQDPTKLESVLSSPVVWTGKNNVTNLGTLLADPKLQSLTQNELMVTALSGLRSAGVVTGTEAPNQLASVVQTASKFGVPNTVDWIKNAAPASLASLMNTTAKTAQYAVNFVDTKAPAVTTSIIPLGGFTDTVQRGAVDQALTAIIGNAKIPTPNFSQGIYSNVPNSELTYTGDDPVVLERINAERRRRGLAPLASGGGVRT